MADSILISIVASVSGLAGVAMGAAITHLRERGRQNRRHLSYWSALSAEIELCRGLADAYTRDLVPAPLYRLSTMAYDDAFPELLADGAVSEEESMAILRFYGQVVQINRGFEYAHEAAQPGASQETLIREVGRLLLKASNLIDPACADSGGPYYERARRAIDPHVGRGARQHGRASGVWRGLRRFLIVVSVLLVLAGVIVNVGFEGAPSIGAPLVTYLLWHMRFVFALVGFLWAAFYLVRWLVRGFPGS